MDLLEVALHRNNGLELGDSNMVIDGASVVIQTGQ